MSAKTTNKYFQYLFEQWDCFHTRPVNFGKAYRRSTYDILPHQPMRQWVLSVPFPLRFLFASNPKVMSRALAIVYRTIATHLTRKAGLTKPTAQTGAVTLIQRFGSALNLNIHFHMLFALN